MLGTPFSPWPCFTDEEAEAAASVLRSNRVNYWTGEEGRQFEAEFAEWVGTRHAVALINGTVALDVALKALGIGSGDEVVVTPRSFIASASCVVNAGAIPVFADVDPDSGNISAETIRPVLTGRTRAIIVVHLGGYPVDMDPIMELAEARGIKVVEDCAQAHGARYRGRSVGSIGDIGAWSFCQDKIMTTGGEGGMITVDDEDLWKAIWSYKDHGKSWDAVYQREHAPGFRWLHESFGTNWRMLEVQAAIGRIQLQRMPHWTAARNANAKRIHDALMPLAEENGPVRLAPFVTSKTRGDVHAYYRYYCYVRPRNLARGWDRGRIAAEIIAAGVPCLHGSCSEIYLEKAFDNSGLGPAQRLPRAMELGETSLAFLVHPTLTEAEIDKTADVAVHVLTAAAGHR
ncbi:MAG: DegT/DnrJ/EryC1/StrS aminotransferase family protein [Sphingomicrobium sp.]